MSKSSFGIEAGPGFKSGLGDLARSLNAHTISAGLLAAIFGMTGPCMVVINSAMGAGYSTEFTISWLMAIYLGGGLLGFVLALKYKVPVAGAYSIPAAVMLSTTLVNYTPAQAVGAYVLAGVLLLVLGASGIIGRIMAWLPLPIVMAMIAGAMIRFGVGIVLSVEKMPIACGVALAAFLLSSRFLKKVPPIVPALVAGVGLAAVMGDFKFAASEITMSGLQFVMPEFTVSGFLAIGLPVALLVIGADSAQASGAMKAANYEVPINGIVTLSGLATLIMSFFGAHSVSVAGPMSAINASDAAGPNKEGRYAASVVTAICFCAFGVLAPLVMGFMQQVPASLVAIVAGLAMIGVLIQAFNMGFSTGKYKIGAFFSLVIAMSNITLFKISAPFWALVGGVIISYIIEPQDFKEKKS